VKPYLLLNLSGCGVSTTQQERFPHSFQVTDIFKQQHVFGTEDSTIVENWIDTIEKNSMQNIISEEFKQ